MTVKLSVLCLTASALVLAAPGYAATATAYLNWSNKQPAAMASTAPAAPYAIPPSPYGQVGDPYKHLLTWSNRSGTQAPVTKVPPTPQAPQAEVEPEPGHSEVASVTVPSQPLSTPLSMPMSEQGRPTAPMHRSTGRYVDPQPAPQTIEPEDDPADNVTATEQAPPPPAPVVRPLPPVAPVAPVAVAAPALKAPVAPAAVPQPAPQDEAYQIPASSPYAARIAAARKLQDDEATAQAQPAPQVASAAPAKAAKPVKGKAKATANTATAPEPAEPLAAQETDHVFIPGEQYTSAADAPRYYSLVREYGLKPDPITVDTHATGALLEPLHDVKTSDDATDDDSDKDADKDAATDDGKDAAHK